MVKYLDSVGLTYLWGKIKSIFVSKEELAVYNATQNTSGTAAVTAKPYTASIWRVDLSDKVTELYTGLTIFLKIPIAGNGTYGTLLRIDGTSAADDSSSNLYPVCANVITMISTRYAVNCIVALTFDATQVGQTLYYQSNSAYTTASGGSGWTKPGCWKIADYDTNTTITYGTLSYYFRPYTRARLTPYKVVACDKDNRVVPITIEQYCGTYGSTTTYAVGDIVVYNDDYYKCIASGKGKTPSTSTSYWQAYTKPAQFTPTDIAFRPDKLRFYNTTTLLAAGAATGGQTLTEIGYNTNVCAYTFGATIPSYKVIYLQGTYNKTTGLFTLDSGADYYTLVPCNTADITLSDYFTSGKYYILLGSTYSSANYFQLFMVNTMYYFDGTNLVPFETKLIGDVVDSIPTKVSDLTNDSGFITSTSVESTYSKLPLVIEVDDTDTTVPSGTYASITTALAAGREVIIKVTATENTNEILYLPLVMDGTSGATAYYFASSKEVEQWIAYINNENVFSFIYYDLSETFTTYSHTHGNIQSRGTLQTNDITIANGDKLVVTDASNSNKVARTSVAFDASTTTKALTQKGTWETFYQKPSTGIPSSDLASGIQTSLGKADTALQSFTETDPVFSSSAAHGISSSDITNWNGKVGSTDVTTIVKLTQNAYDALASVDSNTLYLIIES